MAGMKSWTWKYFQESKESQQIPKKSGTGFLNSKLLSDSIVSNLALSLSAQKFRLVLNEIPRIPKYP